MGSLNDMLKTMGMGKPAGRPQSAVHNAMADLKTPANRQTKAAKELKLVKFDIEWPKVKPQQKKNYFVIHNKEELIKYFEKCAETGICSFDYETGPTKETRLEYRKKMDEANVYLTELKDEYEVGMKTLGTLKEQKAFTKIYEKRVAEYEKAVIKPIIEWYKTSTFCPYAGTVTTVSLSAEEHESAVVYLEHIVGENFKEGSDYFWRLFKEHILHSNNIIKVAFNAKFESKFSLKYGGTILGTLSDPMIAMIRCCQIVKPEIIQNPKVPYAGFGLKDKTREIFGHEMTNYSDLIASKGVEFFADLSTEDIDGLTYSAEDSDYSLQLHNYWKEVAQQIQIERERLETGEWSRPYGNYWEWLCGIEMNFTKVTAMMEYNGIEFNMEKAEIMQKEAEDKFREASDILVKIGEKYGVIVEPGKSGTTSSVKSLLFETLKCPVAKVSVKTDAESLDANSIIDMKFMINNKLKDLIEEQFLRAVLPDVITDKTDLSFSQMKKIEIQKREEHPYKEDALAALEALAKLKKYNTLLGTHIIGRKEHVNKLTGRVHASYDPWTETSRLSSSKPKQHWAA
jgi:DNA polymerase-1